MFKTLAELDEADDYEGMIPGRVAMLNVETNRKEYVYVALSLSLLASPLEPMISITGKESSAIKRLLHLVQHSQVVILCLSSSTFCHRTEKTKMVDLYPTMFGCMSSSVPFASVIRSMFANRQCKIRQQLYLFFGTLDTNYAR